MRKANVFNQILEILEIFVLLNSSSNKRNYDEKYKITILRKACSIKLQQLFSFNSNMLQPKRRNQESI